MAKVRVVGNYAGFKVKEDKHEIADLIDGGRVMIPLSIYKTSGFGDELDDTYFAYVNSVNIVKVE